MRLHFILPLFAALLLIVACFLPWMTVESRSLTITGVDTTGTTFQKPAYFHFLWAGLYVFFLFFNKVWARRTAVILAALNIAWALRNFLLLPACAGGECPVKRAGLYLLLASAFAMFLAPLVEERATKTGL